MIIKEIPKAERPRERLLKYGVENLSNEELLAIMLKTGTRGHSVKELAINVLKKVGKLEKFQNVNIHTFDGIKGLGIVKKQELVVLAELARRIYLEKDLKENINFTNPKLIIETNRFLFYGLKQEYFYVLYLDSKKRLIERKLLFMGTVDKSLVHPREVFKNAYLCSASSFICLHNHPSGDIMPSVADIEITKALIEIGKIQGINLTDHIILSDNSYFSFYENHLME